MGLLTPDATTLTPPKPWISPVWPDVPPAIETLYRPKWMNAVALVNFTSTGGSGGTTVTKPAGGSNGDVYVFWCQEFFSSGGTHAVSGFTQLGVTTTGGSNKTSMWFRIHNGSEGANFTITGPSGGSNCACWLVSGCNTTTPVKASSITAVSGANHTTGTIDTSGVDGCMLLCGFGTDGASITRPSGMTLDANLDGGDFDCSHVIQTTGSASTSKQCTNSSNAGVNIIVAIQPPAGAAVVAPQRAYIVRQAVRRASTR